MTDNFDFFEKYLTASNPKPLQEKMRVSSNTPVFLTDPVVAMAYVPMQYLGTTYDPEEGLSAGTLFPELNKPFKGRMIGG